MNRQEFEHTLIHPINYYSNLSSDCLCDMFDERVSSMVGYNQDNPHHCYDLFMHILHSIENSPKDNIVVRTALFFHDIGKPIVATKKGDKTTFHGHACVSAKIAKELLNTINRYTEDEINYICFLIEHHDDFIGFDKLSEKQIKKHMQRMRTKYTVKDTYWRDITDLHIADTLAQVNLQNSDGRYKVDIALHIKDIILSNI